MMDPVISLRVSSKKVLVLYSLICIIPNIMMGTQFVGTDKSQLILPNVLTCIASYTVEALELL